MSSSTTSTRRWLAGSRLVTGSTVFRGCGDAGRSCEGCVQISPTSFCALVATQAPESRDKCAKRWSGDVRIVMLVTLPIDSTSFLTPE